MKTLSCPEFRQIDLVNYLDSFGYRPQKMRFMDYWYLSQLREEKIPPFKINRKKYICYDHGSGQGGNFIDFGILLFKSSVNDLQHHLAADCYNRTFSFHEHSPYAVSSTERKGETEENTKRRIIVTHARPLTHPFLLNYLESRCIPLEAVARLYQEIDFVLYDKKQTITCFQNGTGGYELRSRNFKSSSSPNAPTFFEYGSQVAAFEGFFDFLSYHVIHPISLIEKTISWYAIHLFFSARYRPQQISRTCQDLNYWFIQGRHILKTKLIIYP